MHIKYSDGAYNQQIFRLNIITLIIIIVIRLHQLKRKFRVFFSEKGHNSVSTWQTEKKAKKHGSANFYGLSIIQMSPIISFDTD